MSKAARWWRPAPDAEGWVLVEDQPYSDRAVCSSLVRHSDLAYYRSHFRLERSWGDNPPMTQPTEAA